MIDLKFEFDTGTGFFTVGPPLNWEKIQMQLMFDQPEVQLQLQSILFQWGGKEAEYIKTHYTSGILGGLGVGEGIGFRMTGLLPEFGPLPFFTGCLNTADKAFSIQDDLITCPLKESGKTDWFYDFAKSFRFEFLTRLPAGAPGRITRADMKQTPYALSWVGTPEAIAATLPVQVALFAMVKESVECVSKIISLVVQAISQSLSWLQLVGTIVQIVLYLIYLIAIIKASHKLIQDICDAILQPKKTKLCMRELDMFLKGCEYMNLRFVSPIYGSNTPDLYQGKYINATDMPIKVSIPDGDPAMEIFTNGRDPDETSNAQAFGYDEGTFYEFVKKMEMLYHAESVIVNGNYYFQEKNSLNIADAFRLPNEGVVGNTFLYPQPFNTNFHELLAVLRLRFQKDDQDTNTYTDYKGTFVCAETKPIIVHNQKNQLLTGEKTIDFPYALARRKVGFTKLESLLLKMIDQLANMLTGITNSINHATSQMSSFMPGIMSAEDVGLSNTQVGFVVSMLLGNPAGAALAIIFGPDGLPIMPSVSLPYFGNNRIGWMLLSADYTGQPKRFIGTQSGDDWLVHENNSEGVFVTTFNPSLSGIFTGTIIGVPGSGIFTGTVIAGILHGSCSTFILGPTSGLVTGTIAGVPGTFTAVVSGTAGGGVFNGHGAINLTIYTTTTTQGWGSAQSLMNDFWYTELPLNNQWLILDKKTFKFGVQDFIQINGKNVLQAPDGKPGKFKSLLWTLADDVVEDVEYRLKYKYTNNLQTVITTDNG